MLVVVELFRGVDPAQHRERFYRAAGARRLDGEVTPRREGIVESLDLEGLESGEADRLTRVAVREFQRQHAHPHKIRPVDALEALGDHGANTEQRGALGRPVARGARTVLLAGHDDERGAALCVLHGHVIDEGRRAAFLHRGPAALGAGHHLVAQPDVREGAAHHHIMIAAARTVRVKVLSLHAVLHEPLASGTGRRNVAGRRDVVRGDGIAEHGQGLRAGDRHHAGR